MLVSSSKFLVEFTCVALKTKEGLSCVDFTGCSVIAGISNTNFNFWVQV